MHFFLPIHVSNGYITGVVVFELLQISWLLTALDLIFAG